MCMLWSTFVDSILPFSWDWSLINGFIFPALKTKLSLALQGFFRAAGGKVLNYSTSFLIKIQNNGTCKERVYSVFSIVNHFTNSLH